MMDQIDQIMSVMPAAFDPLWGEAWNRRQVEDALAMPNTSAFLVDDTGQVLEGGPNKAVGFLMARHAPGEAELLLIAVLPEHRGNGIGLRLIELLKNQVKNLGGERIYLEMRQNNSAEFLYRKAGFEPIGKRPQYYRLADGSRLDAITFGVSV